MPVLSVFGLTMGFGDELLFRDASFSVEKTDKVGLIGANGTGKTTLFNIITGVHSSYNGTVKVHDKVNIGMLSQYACRDSDKTVYGETLSVFEPLINLGRELDEVNALLISSDDQKLIERQQELRERFISRGGLTYENRTAAVLSGLGFSKEEQQLPVSTQSGGQRAKISLSRLLLSDPGLLLLDEPTNHLDIASMEWLEEYILAFNGAAIIISHDRYFLDRVTNKAIEIENRKLYGFAGNYSRYVEQKELREKTVRRQYENTMNEVSRIEGIIKQQRQFNRERNIKTAESKQKQINRLMVGLEIPDKPPEEIRFPVKAVPLSGEEVLRADGLSAVFGSKTVYENVDISLNRAERVFILGDNGVGKTTLLKQLLKHRGRIVFGAGVKPGYFDQLGENLRDCDTVLETMSNAFPRMEFTALRSCLAAFMFKGDEVFKKVEQLSGGERARLSLCRLLTSGANLLFLDEPTNHLDIYARSALEKALSEYGGTILAVSHDRYFINKLASRVAELRPDGIVCYEGGYDDYMAARAGRASAVTRVKKEMGTGGRAYHENKQRMAELRRLEGEINTAMKAIEESEAASKEIMKLLESHASDYERVSELSAALEENNAKTEQLYKKWEELSRELAQKKDTAVFS